MEGHCDQLLWVLLKNRVLDVVVFIDLEIIGFWNLIIIILITAGRENKISWYLHPHQNT